MRALFMKARCRNAGYNPLCTPLLPNEVEDYEAKKGIKERRGDATWLMTHGDRPHHTLGLPKANEPLPSKNKHTPPSGTRPPHQPRGPPFGVIFLKAPCAPVYSNFEGECVSKKNRECCSVLK